MQPVNYHYFIAVAEELNITRAAQKLFITQQTLSGQIAKLEKQYNTVFFERKPKLKLTKQGEVFLKFARTVVVAEKTLDEDLLRCSEQRSLRVGNSSSRGRIVVSGAFRQFAEMFPEASISLVTSDYKALQAMLANNEIDAFTASMRPVSDEFEYEVIYHADFVFVCPKKLLPCSPADFKTKPVGERALIMSEVSMTLSPEEYPLRRTVDNFFNVWGVKPRIKAEISTAAETYEMCKAGLSSAFIPVDALSEIIANDNNSDDLFFWKEKTIDEIEPFSLCYRKNENEMYLKVLSSLMREQAAIIYERAEQRLDSKL